MDTLSQKTMPWGNEKLGTSKYYIWAKGSAITALAEILGFTPDVVNNKLNVVGGFSPDATGELTQIIWEKIVPAFPGWAAQFITPYNNDTVLDALSQGRPVIVFVDATPIDSAGEQHAVRFVGNGLCHDPWDGTEKSTATYPTAYSFVVLTNTAPVEVPVETPAAVEPKVDEQPSLAVTMANLPPHEKEAILNHVRSAVAEIEKLLAV